MVDRTWASMVPEESEASTRGAYGAGEEGEEND